MSRGAGRGTANTLILDAADNALYDHITNEEIRKEYKNVMKLVERGILEIVWECELGRNVQRV